MTLSIIAEGTGLIPAGTQPYGPDDFSAPPTDFGHVIAPRVETTHNFKNAPALDILFVPGGLGVITIEQTNNTGASAVRLLRALGRGWQHLDNFGNGVCYVWRRSSYSGDGAFADIIGLDATYALFSRVYGAQPLNYMLNVIEYAPHLDPTWDPYVTAFNVSTNAKMRVCTDEAYAMIPSW
jgi:hypothetical protein